MQKKAQLVHWTDESVSQETRGSRDMIFLICGFRYIILIYNNKIGYISRFCTCATANRASDRQTNDFFRFNGRAGIRLESRDRSPYAVAGPKRQKLGANPCAWTGAPRAPGKRGQLRVALSSATREWTISPPHTGACGALCGQGTLRP